MSLYKTKSQFNISIRCAMIYGTIEKSHAYHYRSWSLLYIPPAYISYVLYIYIPYTNISSLGAPFHESNHHPRLSCYSIALCWTYAPNDWILREFQGWKDEGRRGAAAAGLLNALADGWGADVTKHYTPARQNVVFLLWAGEREEKKKKGSHNGVLINTYNSNVLHALTGKPIERVAVCDSKEVDVYYYIKGGI